MLFLPIMRNTYLHSIMRGLKYYQEQDNFDLIFLDNGSGSEHRPNQATHRFPKNVYFNGAIVGLGKRC